LLLKQVQVDFFPLRFIVTVGQQDRKAMLGRLLLRATGDIGEEGVSYVENEKPDRAALAGLQLTGGVVAHEAELVDCGLHPGTGRLGDLLRPVEHVGDGAKRDAGPLRHLADTDLRRCCHGHLSSRD
jgi:hypothetical protein